MRSLVDCPVCDSRQTGVRTECGDRERRRFLEYSAVKYGGLMDTWLPTLDPTVQYCLVCGHHWYARQPNPAALAAMYEAGRRLQPDKVVSAAPTSRQMAAMRALHALAKRRARASGVLRLLDYGAGSGRWAMAATKSDFSVVAFEPNATRSYRDDEPIIGLSVVHDLDELGPDPFDAILLEQVLEHVPDPLGVLTRLRQLCHQGTVLRISVPNLHAPVEGNRIWEEWPFNGERPHTMAPFEHLHGFTPESLTRLVDRAGFDRLSARILARYDSRLALRQGASAVFQRAATTRCYAVPLPQGAPGTPPENR